MLGVQWGCCIRSVGLIFLQKFEVPSSLAKEYVLHALRFAFLQGEVIEQQFGEQEVCFRTLDLYTSAVLESSLAPAPKPKQDYRDAMAKMSKARLLRY